MQWNNSALRNMKALTSSKTVGQPCNSLGHCCSKCPTNSVVERGETWVHDAEQTEPGIKPMMKRLLFRYQGCAAHGWRSREDLQQEMCVGNLHGLVCRRGKESLLTRRRGIWVSIPRWYRKVESSHIFSYFVPSLHFTTNQDCMTVPAVWTKQTGNTYLPVPIAWTEEMWRTYCASHQRGQEFCAKALLEKVTEKRKCGQRKGIWESSKRQQLLELCTCLSRPASPGSGDSCQRAVSETLWSTWLLKHYFCTDHIFAHLICYQIAFSFYKKKKTTPDLYLLRLALDMGLYRVHQ